MYKVGIIGPESTGKSTLAKYLARRYNGIYVGEYARTYVEQKGSTDVTWDELCTIARKQIEEQKSYSEAALQQGGLTARRSYNKVVFFDTELIVTKVWFDYAFGKVPEWLDEAVKRYPMDVYLLTYPDIAWEQDSARSNGSDAIRKELYDRYKAEIEALGTPYYIIKHQ